MKRGLQFLLPFVLFFCAQMVYAHKVNMFAFVEGDEVFVEGYFLDGKKPKNCEITVYNESDQVILTGLTNDEGQYSFALPVAKSLLIKLDAGEGHGTEYKLSAEELAMVDGAVATEVVTNEAQDSAQTISPVGVSSPGQADMITIQKAVGRSILPVMRALDELKERRTMSDIIGGIGIIMGIGGLFLYLKAKKMMGEQK